MAISANTCYNSYTPISLGVSYSSVLVGILLEVHPTTEVIVRFLPGDFENHCWALHQIPKILIDIISIRGQVSMEAFQQRPSVQYLVHFEI